ncbi:MAG: FAD-binding protein [Burkholderiaceae bacterium]|nr:FAD-binding protein [Burkholderiaceae bacterium]
MSVLVVADHNTLELNPAMRSVVACALEISSEVDFLVTGHECQKVADDATKLHGIRKVLLAQAECLAKGLPENLSAQVLMLAGQYSHILFLANPGGKSAAPRVAAKLDVAQISEVIAVIDGDTFKRPLYAGSIIATVRSSDAKKVITVRPTAFNPVALDNTVATVETIEAVKKDERVVFVSHETVHSDRPDLQTAKRVLAGGHGLANEAEFAEMEALADQLGAAVGSTRAVVDAGITPNDWQIGQTGKIIAPDLYIGFGISGAIQHVAGIKDAKVIVAVNKDPEAPIFEVADYGLVADAMTTIRELKAKL